MGEIWVRCGRDVRKMGEMWARWVRCERDVREMGEICVRYRRDTKSRVRCVFPLSMSIVCIAGCTTLYIAGGYAVNRDTLLCTLLGARVVAVGRVRLARVDATVYTSVYSALLCTVLDTCIDVKNHVGHVVQKITIVGHRHDGALVRAEPPVYVLRGSEI